MATQQPMPVVDQAKLEQFTGKMVSELGAAMNAALVLVGDKLGLFKTMAEGGPVTPAELAQKTGTDERYIREWLNGNAAGGYVTYDQESRKYSLSPEQAIVFAIEDSPLFMPGAFEVVASVMKDEPKITEAFRTGQGVGWDQHCADLFRGTERFFRPSYATHLVSSWIPALDGVEEKLRQGGRVADVGCGRGSSTILMAQAYPNSTFIGFDYHAPSIEAARETAARMGVADRATFEVARAKDFPGRDFDLVAFFDCLHDMGDPAGAAKHVYGSLAPEGAWMIVEPFANDRLEDNLNIVGRVFYCASTMICTPASKAQEVGLALGAQAGEAKLREVVTQGGFTRFRRATETPFNLVFEAKR